MRRSWAGLAGPATGLAFGLVVSLVVGLVVIAVGLSACRPELDDRTFLVDRVRVLAVRADPPEALPGQATQLSVLVADGTGARPDLTLDLAFCSEKKALAESSPVSASCLDDRSILRFDGLAGALPAEVCGRFGPERLPGKDGEPSGRPSDPDGTGGYYQPGRVRVGGVPAADPALFEVRATCGLPGATLEVVAGFGARYVANRNPALTVRVDDREIGEGATIEATIGQALALTATWPTCDVPGPCEGAERYVAFDPATRTLVDRREAMRVSWLSTGGNLRDDRTGREEGELDTRTATVFTAPQEARTATVFVVLRDTRGGVVWRTFRVTTR